MTPRHQDRQDRPRWPTAFTSADDTRAIHRDFTQATLEARHLVTDAETPPAVVAGEILDRLAVGGISWTVPSDSSPRE
jgi:hypothetical protein